ncbi:copper sensor histidine kinase [Pseudomonas sp. StFLB209]|nr:copper sensor histidine kinase [Pseudomonas sp. StFLB209]
MSRLARLSLRSRLALLFAGCTALVSLIAGALFSQTSASHFVELDQQLFDSRLASLRAALQDVKDPAALATHQTQLTSHADLMLRISDAQGHIWFDNTPSQLSLPSSTGLHTLSETLGDYRVFTAPLDPAQPGSPRLTLVLDITHHQHFLQRMQHLIWLTVGLCALATALLGAWAARSGLRPLQRMSAVAAGVSASSLTTRLPDARMPAELAELTRTFNAMLTRLEDSFQRLSAFSADIAHELRTPLSNLLTQTQVTLTRQRTPEHYRETLLGNLEELQSLAQMVNDMLLLAKTEQGLLAPAQDELRLEDEADAVLEYLAPLAEDASIELHRVGQAVSRGDRALLRRVLSNLLSNALRFTPSGGQIAVILQDSAAGAMLTVENPGADIPPHVVARLFDRFYRADTSRADRHEHAGLGLAICRSIIHAHGGTIECQSQGGLTRFVIRLPAYS